MRVIQLIDSLDPGGAERMAINIANGLSARIAFSALAVSRKEGALKAAIGNEVGYHFLEKKKTIDFTALRSFIRFLKTNEINVVHAHGSSYFFGVLTKIAYPKIKLFWHDHHGNRVNISKTNWVIRLVSVFFSGVFTVNQELKTWAEKNLWCRNVDFVPNFSSSGKQNSQNTELYGEAGKRIVCLANLRTPKNHITLLRAFHESKLAESGWTLHFIGKDHHDAYSEDLKNFIAKNDLRQAVFLYDVRNDIPYILKQATLGVLVSTFEGFPVTLLEYASQQLAVISSNVGYCSEIIQDGKTGLSFSPLDHSALKVKIITLAQNEELRRTLASNLTNFVASNYSEDSVLDLLIKKYTES